MNFDFLKQASGPLNDPEKKSNTFTSAWCPCKY